MLSVVVAIAVVRCSVVIWNTEPGPWTMSPARLVGVGNGIEPSGVAPSSTPAALTPAPLALRRGPAASARTSEPRQRGRRPCAPIGARRLRAAARRAPDNAEMLNKLGHLLERMGDTGEAAARFERAVALAPRKSDYRLNLARAASGLGQWDRAVDQYARRCACSR